MRTDSTGVAKKWRYTETNNIDLALISETYFSVKKYHSEREYTYFSSDISKIPDLLGFFIFKMIPSKCVNLANICGLTSDYTSVVTANFRINSFWEN